MKKNTASPKKKSISPRKGLFSTNYKLSSKFFVSTGQLIYILNICLRKIFVMAFSMRND